VSFVDVNVMWTFVDTVKMNVLYLIKKKKKMWQQITSNIIH